MESDDDDNSNDTDLYDMSGKYDSRDIIKGREDAVSTNMTTRSRISTAYMRSLRKTMVKIVIMMKIGTTRRRRNGITRRTTKM